MIKRKKIKKSVKKTKKKATKKKSSSASNSLRVELLKKHLRLPHGYTIVKRKK